MKKVVLKSLLAGVVALLGFSAAARASATISISGLTDQGSWRINSFDGSNVVNGTASSNLVNPYGVPPGPTITAITNGWVLTFNPTSDFLAYAANSPTTGQSVIMDGKLDFNLAINDAQNPTSTFRITTNVYEDGIYAVSGNGTVGVSGGVVVNAINNSNVILEQHMAALPAETRNGLGGWTDFAQASFNGTAGYNLYHISIDNTLLARSFANANPGSGYIAKKDFSIIITTDGSNGGGAGTPEPASLGMLALGGVALLSRRRRRA